MLFTWTKKQVMEEEKRVAEGEREREGRRERDHPERLVVIKLALSQIGRAHV